MMRSKYFIFFVFSCFFIENESSDVKLPEFNIVLLGEKGVGKKWIINKLYGNNINETSDHFSIALSKKFPRNDKTINIQLSAIDKNLDSYGPIEKVDLFLLVVDGSSMDFGFSDNNPLFSAFYNFCYKTNKDTPRIVVFNKLQENLKINEYSKSFFFENKKFGVLDKDEKACFEYLGIKQNQEDLEEVWEVLENIAFMSDAEGNILHIRKESANNVGCWENIKNWCCPNKKKKKIIKES